MTRGRIAAALATSAVALLVLAVASGVVLALQGAYLLLAAPVVGLWMGLGVWAALRRVCTTGSRCAQAIALSGIVLMPVVGILGVSFGGIALLVPAALFALARAVTPRPRAPLGCAHG